MDYKTAIILLIAGFVVGLICGLLLYAKKLDKPETVNKIDRMRTRGRGNTVLIEREVSFSKTEESPKLGIIQRIKNRRKAKKEDK